MHSTKFLLLTVAFAGLSAQASPEDAAYEKALAYYEQKNYDACLTALRPVIKEKDSKPDLRILVAHCHAAKKNYADAVAHLRIVTEEFPDQAGVREDILALLNADGRYRDARKIGYRYMSALKKQDKPASPALLLATARAELGYGHASAALDLAREAKQSDDANIKYGSIIAETRALIALSNFSEADISLSYAEAMRQSELHALLRANIAELTWAQEKFPEQKRADIVALYEKLSRSQNAEIKLAADRNIERVKAAKAP
jgi:tellurite resistance protein